jgi:hypothetical protein
MLLFSYCDQIHRVLNSPNKILHRVKRFAYCYQFLQFSEAHVTTIKVLQRVEDSLIVIIQLILSVSTCPKVITVNGFHCIYLPSNDSSPERPQTAPPPLPRRSPALRPHLPDRQPDATLHAKMTSRNEK